jgi:hypothetical protein
MRCGVEMYDVISGNYINMNKISSMTLCKLNEDEMFMVYYNQDDELYLNHLSLFDVMGFATRLRYNKALNEFEVDLDGPFMNKDNEGKEFAVLVRNWKEFEKNWQIEMCCQMEKGAEYPYNIYFELCRKEYKK